ncbi:MAG TPA: putative baseplate assembly protein [Anaerolineaceae bacterium]|nr:putative baseplate assembly protein [Anaerolineaceae bacterium]HPN52370.1 putative baseplate assembly protein [Anaerolineaceae bacterium]
MSLPSPNLDDLRFQRDLVDEARKRIIHYCPEWTEYNLSDPGITLIELFAWMTELITYRLNQVPEKNYLKFLELLGTTLQPASSAKTDLTFWLSVPLPINPEDTTSVIVPEGVEVASRPSGDEEQVIFTTERKLVIKPPSLTQVRRESEFHKNALPRLGIEIFYPFNQQKPKPGDTFYLGFDETVDISGHILKLDFQCNPTAAVGIRREDPPWVWECSNGKGDWLEITPSDFPGEKDTTGGLNNPAGSLVFYLPLAFKPETVQGRSAFWLRCRLEQRDPSQGMYTESPRIVSLRATTLGGTVPASHAIVINYENLGMSNGDPGQTFNLSHAPILETTPDECIEVEEMNLGELVFVPWKRVDTFAFSDRFDRHYMLDTANGVVQFGPSIRQSDGTMRQYGRVPESHRTIRFSHYRFGGGVKGNVPVDSLQTITTALAYISRVTNLRRAAGGQDPETLEEAKVRARRMLRAQKRAVTSEDYQQICKEASRGVARARCNLPRPVEGLPSSGVVEILVVPAVADSLRAGDLSHLALDDYLIKTVTQYLDQYRVLTSIVRVREPSYLGIKVIARVVPADYSHPETVRQRIDERLRSYLSPLPLQTSEDTSDDFTGPGWEGWVFGKDLFIAELIALIQHVPGVKYVLDVQVQSRQVIPRLELPLDAAASAPPPPLTQTDEKVIPVPEDTLVCSLNHEIIMAGLSELYGDD